MAKADEKSTPAKPNRVLSLGGDGDCVEMADSEVLNHVGPWITIEAWIKPTAFPNQWIAIIHKADERVEGFSNRSYVLMLNNQGFIQLASAPTGRGQIEIQSPDGSISLNNWYHIAGVVDAKDGLMRLFINGTEVARGDFAGDIHVSKLPLWIGWTHDPSPQSACFAGQMSEVRIWNTARTQEEIRGTMHIALSGSEPGLVGYWRLDDEDGVVRDSSPNRVHGRLMGDARIMEAELPRPDELNIPTVVSGTVRDELGSPLHVALVRLMHRDVEIAQAWTDISGQYGIFISRFNDGRYDVSATSGKRGQMLLDMPLRKGESESLDFTLREDVSITGTLLMLDDRTPHIYAAVQAMRNGKVIDTTWSDRDGKYWFVSLKPGEYHVRCQTLGGYIYYAEERKGKRESEKVGKRESQKAGGRGSEEAGGRGDGDILRVEAGKTLKNIDFRFAPFKNGTWRKYTSVHGLATMQVHSICEDASGVLWFASCSRNVRNAGGGVPCYDGREFVTFTAEDGLASNNVWAVHSTSDGILWFGTEDNGVSRYDSREFISFTTEDGLAHNEVLAIDSTPDGVLWFGTAGGGVSRYDGNSFTNFTTRDGLASNSVAAVHCDPDGTLWFGTWNGISRYDGNGFVNFPTDDGLLNVTTIHRDPHGILWFGTGDVWNRGHGVFRYDGRKFDNLTYRDGLRGSSVQAINSTSDGVMWFGTYADLGLGGISRYNGETFANFGTEDGLPFYSVEAIHVSSDGALWMGTGLGGVARYDERSFVSLSSADGLPGDNVQATYRSPDGSLWIGARTGIAHYDDGMEPGLLNTFTREDGWVPRRVSVIHRSSDGSLWFGTGGIDVNGIGIFRYDEVNGEPARFVNLTTRDGLAHNRIFAIHSDADGTIWIGTEVGLSRYDGREFVNFSAEDGLAGNRVEDIYCDANGILWFGTYGGISRYDGKEFANLTTEDGLAHNWVSAIQGDSDGVMWIGTARGVSCFNGRDFVNYTTADVPTGNLVWKVYCSDNGIVWFGSWGGGVSGFDGTAWTSLDTRDGLLSDVVQSIDPDTDGSLWIGTRDGVTRYRRDTTPPRVRIISVTTDKAYHDLSTIPPFNPGTRVTVSYNAIDLKTLPEKRQYRCRVYETSRRGNLDSTVSSLKSDAPYNPPTRDTTFDWTPEKPGTYVFEVQAIDRDLNYSEPASVKLEVIPDPRNHRIIQLEEHIHQQELAELERVHQELEDARQIQLSLLPKELPQMSGYEIAGTSRPAREVSGDFYTYLSLGKNTGIVLADVTGKSVKAAMIATLADGMLNEATKSRRDLWNSPGMILSELNVGLQPRLMRGMFVAMSLGILQTEEKRLIFSNSGMPYPIAKRGRGVWELEVNGLPLGLMDGVEYDDMAFEIEPGDFLVFYSDGVIEATNEAEEMYQTERLLEVMKQADSDISAQEMVDLIIRDVTEFAGNTELSDDITIVVLRCGN